jgi:hypothetical protein
LIEAILAFGCADACSKQELHLSITLVECQGLEELSRNGLEYN